MNTLLNAIDAALARLKAIQLNGWIIIIGATWTFFADILSRPEIYAATTQPSDNPAHVPAWMAAMMAMYASVTQTINRKKL